MVSLSRELVAADQFGLIFFFFVPSFSCCVGVKGREGGKEEEEKDIVE